MLRCAFSVPPDTEGTVPLCLWQCALLLREPRQGDSSLCAQPVLLQDVHRCFATSPSCVLVTILLCQFHLHHVTCGSQFTLPHESQLNLYSFLFHFVYLTQVPDPLSVNSVMFILPLFFCHHFSSSPFLITTNSVFVSFCCLRISLLKLCTISSKRKKVFGLFLLNEKII